MQIISRTVRVVAIAPIHVYRIVVSPFIAQRCRYYPTCSAYGIEAIRTYGPARGVVLALWRVLRCNPLCKGGMDELIDQRMFKTRQPETDRHACLDCAPKAVS